MRWERIKMVQRVIDTADSSELSEIAQAVLRRYGKLFEDEEVAFLSLPKHNRGERQRIIGEILSMEQQGEQK